MARKKVRKETQIKTQLPEYYSEEVRQAVDKIKAAPLRENILAFAQKMTSRIGFEVTKDDPEYWGFAGIMTDEMCEVAMQMEIRKPVTLPELTKITGKEPSELKRILDEMAKIGIIEYNRENPQRELQYVLPILVPGNAEFLNMNYQQMLDHPEVAQLFDHMAILALESITPMVPIGGAGIGMHVIPVEKAIEAENQSVDVEHISHWLNKYDKYAASPCSCRYTRKIQNEGCADDPEEWCIAVGDMADYCVETGKGRYIDYDEVLHILKVSEDNGFVHQITNIDGEDKIFAICNCNVDVCFALRTSQLFNTPNISRSAYVARVDKDKCVACGGCANHCPAGAVKLGQKLCQKDGTKLEYPKQELPDAIEWGPEKWDEDYRNTLRKEVWPGGTAPCKTACPAHISVQGYLKLASQGKYSEALALIKKNNPFAAVCGRICNRPCEDVCTRGTIDEPIAIDEIKKFVAEKDLDPDHRYVPPIIQPSMRGPFKEKIAIIGAGPAGLSCAYFLALKGYKPTVFEKNDQPGGMLRYGIPSYKLEKDVIEAEIDIIRELGVEIRCGIEIGKDLTLDDLRQEGYTGFYLAIGCQGARKANVPGEETAGVYSALELLASAQTDNKPKLTGKLVVIGGGNVAMDAARTGLRLGADEVEVFCLESLDEMPASPEEIAEAEEEGIKINCSWGIKEVKSDKGQLTGVELIRCTCVFDEDGKFAPQYDSSESRLVACDNLCLSIGQKTEWGKILEASKAEPVNGRVTADPHTFQTLEPDVFIGGDAYTGPGFAIDAIAQGKEAAVSLHRFVQPRSSLTIGRHPHAYSQLDVDNIQVLDYDQAGRQQAENVRHGRLDFKEYIEPLTEEQVKIETARCLSCGAAEVDENRCIGCGICTTKCEFDAIHLHREHPKASRMARTEDTVKKIMPYALKRKVKIRWNKIKQARVTQKSR